MEPSRFDELTKALATATSRRQALKTIVATTIGSILGLGGIGTAFADKTCKNLGQGCNNKKNLCCPGLICQGGMCVAAPTTTTTTTTAPPTTTTTTTTASTCLSLGAICTATSPPCCVPGDCFRLVGAPNATCCIDTQSSGCTKATDCCATGASCLSGVCVV